MRFAWLVLLIGIVFLHFYFLMVHLYCCVNSAATILFYCFVQAVHLYLNTCKDNVSQVDYVPATHPLCRQHVSDILNINEHGPDYIAVLLRTNGQLLLTRQ